MIIKSVGRKKNIFLIKPDVAKGSIGEIVDDIKSSIEKKSCQNLILDLTGFNILNSVKVGVLAATYHFVEFINGKIYLIVNDKQAKKSIEILNLSNAVVIYNNGNLILENIA